jgi:hypothetical protein
MRMSRTRRSREHEPRHVIREHLAREEHFEASARVRPGRERNERVNLDVRRLRKRAPDEIHECARLRDALRCGVVEVGVGME